MFEVKHSNWRERPPKRFCTDRGPAETQKAKIPQLFLHKCKADHFRKHTTCQNILRQYHTISKIRGNIRSSVKKTQEHIQFIFFLHMNDHAAEVPLKLSITNRLIHSTESQKAKQECKRRDRIYLTRSTIAPGTSLPQEKIRILKRHLPWDSVNMGWCSHTTQHHMCLQNFTVSWARMQTPQVISLSKFLPEPDILLYFHSCWKALSHPYSTMSKFSWLLRWSTLPI